MTLEKAKYHAVKYLSYQPRTIQEVNSYLQKKEYNQQIISEVINYLKDQSYLDDDKFCQLWIESRCRLKPRGKRGLYFELKNKGVDSSLIEEVINKNFTPEIELKIAKELVLKKAQVLNGNSSNIKEKIGAFLYRKGFSNNVIQKIVSEL